MICELMQRLPEDVILKIQSYICRPQCLILLDDIESFARCKTLILRDYHEYWIGLMQENEPEDKNWVFNDIVYFLNNYNPMITGYFNPLSEVIKRKTRIDPPRYIDFLMHEKPIETAINIILGLMTSYERSCFIVNHCKRFEQITFEY